MKNTIISVNDIKLFLKKLEIFSDKICKEISKVLQAILNSRKLRISQLAYQMGDKFETNYKKIQRLLNVLDLKDLELAITKLYPKNESEFILIDPTEIERPDARNTEYVGFLKDKVRGYLNLICAFPYKGRAIPFYFQTYSSKTIANELSSRNNIWKNITKKLKFLAEGKTIIADREFCAESYISSLIHENIDFVIRLKAGNPKSPTLIADINGKKIDYLNVKKGKKRHWKNVFYKGKICVNLARYWDKKYSTPIFLITNKDPKSALNIYKQRMKIEESIRDLKDKLGIDKNMCKTKANNDKLTALAILSYCISLLIGESMREKMKKSKRKQMSGLFIVLHYAHFFTRNFIRKAVKKALNIFERIVSSNRHFLFLYYD